MQQQFLNAFVAITVNIFFVLRRDPDNIQNKQINGSNWICTPSKSSKITFDDTRYILLHDAPGKKSIVRTFPYFKRTAQFSCSRKTSLPQNNVIYYLPRNTSRPHPRTNCLILHILVQRPLRLNCLHPSCGHVPSSGSFRYPYIALSIFRDPRFLYSSGRPIFLLSDWELLPRIGVSFFQLFQRGF